MKFSSTLAALAFAAAATAAPSKTEAESPNPVAVAPRQVTSGAGSSCNPGSYQCRNGNSDIYVCNGSRSWQLSARCSAGRCVQANGGAYCT
ncbi:uncharacterized protein PpBr36_10882 [Pyricularia pennisetigena]|uniref:uncharacterized protein n=1 Tax=Pyricularia pennisetigena TaxID=1578925 RepID=UPI001154705E|nr:uncharacterized protein PpBr36_10882 [Pyricularia pennisetigena]TLS21033.1 hypothetical protein PpBr36_10882 [Pyricularia pennisetigena]